MYIAKMDLATALLDSWDRQCRILMSVASRVDESNRKVKPSEDGWSLDRQLGHIHETRYWWLSQVAKSHADTLGETFQPDGETPIDDLDEIRNQLNVSAKTVRQATQELIADGLQPVGGYDNPVLFLQHMVWHEGWHVGLLMLGLRLAGQEPAPDWEEAHIWGEWRTES
jgi:uncharacterized damage-inducible protein DinB